MKLILSRKGFDSSAGGVPSPIFPDNRMVSLPIPDKHSDVSYAEISYQGESLGHIVEELTKGRVPSHYRAHIDPDIASGSLPRQPDWRPIFGQTGQSQSHLRNNNVGVGDLFIFFGLFQRIEIQNGSRSYGHNTSRSHVIWGWLQIGDIISLDGSTPQGYEWAQYHPHFKRKADPNNIAYISSNKLILDGVETDLPGAGTFSRFSLTQKLTASYAQNISTWELPGWFFPDNNKKPLTYHSDITRWKKRGSKTELTSVARGQEFVLDCKEYPEAIDWACNLIKKGREKDA